MVINNNYRGPNTPRSVDEWPAWYVMYCISWCMSIVVVDGVNDVETAVDVAAAGCRVVVADAALLSRLASPTLDA